MAEWREALVYAAARRARVRLTDGSEGVLVYAPGKNADADSEHEPRHGDRTKCGVRLDIDPKWVKAVEPDEIAAVLP